MALKFTKQSLQQGFPNLGDLEQNFSNLETATADGLSRKGDAPNSMSAPIDMNSNQILNLPQATTAGHAVEFSQLLGTTTSTSFTGYTVEEIIATAGQTVFTLSSSYTQGISAIRVYINGVYQAPSGYTETSTTVITFSVGLEAGDVAAFVHSSFTAAGAQASSAVTYTPGGTGAVASNVQAKLRELRSVKDFGAIGDGVADDTAALQAALDTNEVCIVPPGRYRTTANLIVDPIRNRNNGFIGTTAISVYPETTQIGGPVWTSGANESVIWYDGTGGAASAIIALSSELVPTEPGSTFEDNILSFEFRNITLDGNDTVHYGFYSARYQHCNVRDCVVRATVKNGWYINGSFSGSFTNIQAFANQGRGIAIGAAREDHTWTTNFAVNGVTFYDLYATGSGSLKEFDDVTAPRLGCGVYFGPKRGCQIVGVISENNDGVGICFFPTSFGNSIQSIYTELNSDFLVGGTSAIDDGRADFSYGIRFDGFTGGTSYGNRVQTAFLSSEKLWIQGTEPSTGRPESAPEFNNITGSGSTIAAYPTYKLVNCSVEYHTITGSAGTSGYHIPAGVLFDLSENNLNVYDEGSWTPTLEGSTVAGTGWTYTINAGRYTRIGRLVYFSGRLVLSAIGSGATGDVLLKTLPFPVPNTNGFQSSVNISRLASMTTAIVDMTADAEINTSQVRFYHRTAAAATFTITNITDISATTAFNISGYYQV